MAKSNTNAVAKPNIFVRIANYLKEVYEELRYKVSWPTKAELANSAVIVLIASIIIAVFVFLVDKSFETIISELYKLITR